MTGWTGGVTAVSIAIMAGCGGSPPSTRSTSAARTSSLVAPGDDCPETGCGLNGAWLGENISFRDLDLSGRANRGGWKIESFETEDGTNLKIDVKDDELIGVLREKRLLRKDLREAVITLSRNPREKYQLTIKDVRPTKFWTEPCAREESGCSDESDTVQLYTIEYRRAGSALPKKRNICSPVMGTDPTVREIDGTVVIFRGDQYDDNTYRVQADGASTWFNIACVGTAISKLHLLRHTTAGSRGMAWSRDSRRRLTTLAQRQTLLRMLTGDYCGIGYSFTVNGHPLTYTFAQRNWEPQVPWRFDESSPSGETNASIDALWNEHGAVCIGTPRLSDQEPEAALLQRIQEKCGWFRLASGHLVRRPAQPGAMTPSRPLPRRPPICDRKILAEAMDPEVRADALARTGSYAVSANRASR